VNVPRGENPQEVGWEIKQGRDVVKRVPFGSYRQADIYYEQMRVRTGRQFTFYVDMQRSTYGRGE
jgi:hypothetical protein